MTQPVSIYALCDPRSGAIRYVGKTARALNDRLQDHLSAARCAGRGDTYLHRWIRKLLAEDLRPEIELLEECDGSLWQECEQHWIAYGKDKGWRLTNATAGGDGTEGLSLEARVKISQAALGNQRWLGRKHKQGTRDRLSEIAIGRPSGFRGHSHSDLAKAKIRANARCQRGENNANAKLTVEDVQNIQRAYADGGITQSELARRYGLRQPNISAILRGNVWRDHHILTGELLEAAKEENYRLQKRGMPREANPQAKLSAEQVAQIRDGRLQGKLLRELAERYGVAESTISRIVSHKRWGYTQQE